MDSGAELENALFTESNLKLEVCFAVCARTSVICDQKLLQLKSKGVNSTSCLLNATEPSNIDIAMSSSFSPVSLNELRESQSSGDGCPKGLIPSVYFGDHFDSQQKGPSVLLQIFACLCFTAV